MYRQRKKRPKSHLAALKWHKIHLTRSFHSACLNAHINLILHELADLHILNRPILRFQTNYKSGRFTKNRSFSYHFLNIVPRLNPDLFGDVNLVSMFIEINKIFVLFCFSLLE